MAAHQQRMGQLIAEARADLGITQEEAARRIGVGYRTYQKWEEGRNSPYPRNLKAASRVFGRTVEELGGEPLEEYIPDQLDRIEQKLDALLAVLGATQPAADDAELDQATAALEQAGQEHQQGSEGEEQGPRRADPASPPQAS